MQCHMNNQLSPAAQAVLDAVLQVSNLSPTVPVAVAALRAAASQLTNAKSADALRAIAAKLDSNTNNM